MKGTIINYRGSYKEQDTKHMIIKVEGIDKKADTKKIIGKKAVWTTPTGKKISGVIAAPHGGKGAVRAIFAEKGLPGQALGTQIEID